MEQLWNEDDLTQRALALSRDWHCDQCLQVAHSITAITQACMTLTFAIVRGFLGTPWRHRMSKANRGLDATYVHVTDEGCGQGA